MFKSHLNAIEAVLVAQSKIASSAGHPNLRGNPREWFIRNFLSNHLPSALGIGQGEIINSLSEPRPPPKKYRPQVDIVVHREDFPKIHYGGDNTAFLHESVLATIEVKTKLTKKKLHDAFIRSAINKALKYSDSGVQGIVIGDRYPTNIVSYIVAYDGPKKLSTVQGWISSFREENKYEADQLPEMVIILGKGIFWRILTFQGIRNIKYDPKKHTWISSQQNENNLFLMFVHMLSWMSPPQVRNYAEGTIIGDYTVF